MGGFERHIREAIELNRRRAPLYAEASAGVSLAISRSLIRRERMLLPFARWLDGRAEGYRRAGIPIMDELFVSMSGAPSFLARTPPSLPTRDPTDIRGMVRALRRAARDGGLPGALPLLDAELVRLTADAGCWCMLRHLLESARRVASCSAPHAERARQAGLPSPLWIHRLLFRLHLLGLPGAAALDLRALPLQRAGIPILCRDLPPIELA
jgi:hypothetical protein